jgi:uncharacterized protein (TIGR00375 family)
MRYISDLHIHSRHSRATSKQLDIINLEKYARIKGVNLLGTGDFTHPVWLKELKELLEDDGSGIYKTGSGFNFVLQSEISLIYSQEGSGRKVHVVFFARDFDTVDQINSELLKRGRIDYDGRPIFGIPCPDFVEMLKSIDRSIEVIPAHVWTPWFGLFGSMSGFDSVEECFKDQSKHIFAFETGLSSDPEMNWRISANDKYSLISNSDSHSFWPWRLGREANIFEIKDLTYDNLMRSIRTRDGFKETIEVDPGYGKYHFDGHRNCNIVMSPLQSMKYKDICPVCKKKLNIGVLHRIEELADREDGFKPDNAVPFRRIIPLSDILAGILNTSVSTKKVWERYYEILKPFGSEYDVLLDAPREDLSRVADEKIVDAVIRNREGKIYVKPGYDGVYGVPLLGNKNADEPDIPEPVFTSQEPVQKDLNDFFKK